jgi:hypothetical protein
MSRKIQPENKYTVGVWRINQKYYHIFYNGIYTRFTKIPYITKLFLYIKILILHDNHQISWENIKLTCTGNSQTIWTCVYIYIYGCIYLYVYVCIYH